MKPFPTVFLMFGGLVPSIVCSAPIGYFLAMLLGMQNGAWLALLFMLPVLLARYSFKLYLDGQRQQYSIVKAFAAALEAKDTYTLGHSSRVAAYTVRIAQAMKLPEKRIRLLSDAALFHDIGKIGVPDSILQKPGALTPEERAIIQRHPQQGVDILRNIDAYQELIPLIDLAGYDLLFIGTPNWWSSPAPPVAAFLDRAELSGKRIAPFCTHGGGGSGHIRRDIEALCPGTAVLPELAVYGGDCRESQVRSWLSRIQA